MSINRWRGGLCAAAAVATVFTVGGADGVAQAASQDTGRPAVTPWGYVSRNPIGHLDRLKTVVWISSVRDSRNIYWVAERRTGGPRGEMMRNWADSRSCPALLRALADIGRLPRPMLAPPLSPLRGRDVILDGIDYAVEGPAANVTGWSSGRMRLTSNVGTPLARWVDHTLAELHTCWSDRMPD